jgi:hypothetical protein
MALGNVGAQRDGTRWLSKACGVNVPRDERRYGQGARLPVLVCNPADDSAFCSAAETALRERPSGPAAMELELRVGYPRAVVRAREISNEAVAVWYVYRDGRWTPAGTAPAEGVA